MSRKFTGWFKFDRSLCLIDEYPIFKDMTMLGIFTKIQAMAAWEDGPKCRAGHLITSYAELARMTDTNNTKMRRIIEKFIKIGLLEKSQTLKGLCIKIVPILNNLCIENDQILNSITSCNDNEKPSAENKTCTKNEENLNQNGSINENNPAALLQLLQPNNKKLNNAYTTTTVPQRLGNIGAEKNNQENLMQDSGGGSDSRVKISSDFLSSQTQEILIQSKIKNIHAIEIAAKSMGISETQVAILAAQMYSKITGKKDIADSDSYFIAWMKKESEKQASKKDSGSEGKEAKTEWGENPTEDDWTKGL